MKLGWRHQVAGLVVLALAGCQNTGAVANGGSSPVVPSTPAAGGLATAVESTPTPMSTASPEGTASPADATPSASGTPLAPAPAGKPLENTLAPLEGKVGQQPTITRKETIKMVTSAGEVVIDVYPEAAPNAVKRFNELVSSGFFDETPVSRVVKDPQPFVAQFGINWREPHNKWEKNTFKDDPSFFKLERGTLAFAKGGPDTNSTQVFINYQDNSHLAEPSMNFTAFGKVVKGMDVVDKFLPVGDPGGGLDQLRLWTDGGNYLESLTTKPTMIEKMTVVKP